MSDTFDFATFRNPANAPLRSAVSDAKDEVAGHLLAVSPSFGNIFTPELIAQLMATFGPLLASLLTKKPPVPVVQPPVVPPVVPPPTPAPKPVDKPIAVSAGSKLKLTGYTIGGPLGKRGDPKALLAGGTGPKDARLEFDFTPMFSDGLPGQPGIDPRIAALPRAPYREGIDTVPPTQAFRLRFSPFGDLKQADLSHEYYLDGVLPRARIICNTNGKGGIRDIYIEGANDLVVPLTDNAGNEVSELNFSDV